MNNEELEQIKQSAIAKLKKAIYNLQEGGNARQALSWCLDAKEDLDLFLENVSSCHLDAATPCAKCGTTRNVVGGKYCPVCGTPRR